MIDTREYWVVDAEGSDVAGPYDTEQTAKTVKVDKEAELGIILYVTNTDDAH